MNLSNSFRAAALLLALASASELHSAKLTTYPYRNSVVRTCQVDLRQDRLRMFWKDDRGVPFGDFARLQDWLRSQEEELVCATNGGIYQEDLRPLGLYVEEGRILHPLNGRKGAYGNFYLEPNGIFLVEGQQARIVETARFHNEFADTIRSVRFATQSGPILIQNGHINRLFAPQSRNRNIRSAICVVSPSEIVLALTDTPMSFHEFSRFLRDTLHCTDALHMDSKVSRLFPQHGFGLGPPFSVIIAATRTVRAHASN